jgi:SAM-dependent methyltransferase
MQLEDKISQYYTDKIQQNGPTPAGVDWNGEDSQQLRFKFLSEVLPAEPGFSLLDFGCGYGALLDYLQQSGCKEFSYTGLDIAEDMLGAARKAHPEKKWLSSLPDDFQTDFSILSGIFNVRLDVSVEEWEKYIYDTLEKVNSISTRGFAFNMLTSYSDPEYCKDYLYYAVPENIFRYCKTHFSKFVLLNHSYPLYEFTLIVRK